MIDGELRIRSKSARYNFLFRCLSRPFRFDNTVGFYVTFSIFHTVYMHDYSRPRNVLAVQQVQIAGRGDKNAVAKEEVKDVIYYIIYYIERGANGRWGGGETVVLQCRVLGRTLPNRSMTGWYIVDDRPSNSAFFWPPVCRTIHGYS